VVHLPGSTQARQKVNVLVDARCSWPTAAGFTLC